LQACVSSYDATDATAKNLLIVLCQVVLDGETGKTPLMKRRQMVIQSSGNMTGSLPFEGIAGSVCVST
jgi:hypothetical protein